MKLCKCGCGGAVAEGRVFVNRQHQTDWMRTEAASFSQPVEVEPQHRWFSRQEHRDNGAWYSIGFAISSFVTFFATWIYCIAEYGFLLGVGLGWLPASIVAVVIGAVWPLIVLLGALAWLSIRS